MPACSCRVFMTVAVGKSSMRKVPVSKPFTAFLGIHQRCTHHHSYTYRSVAFCDRHSQRCLPTFVSPTTTTAKFHLLCYAHGIGTDSNRLAHLTVPRNVVKASANEYPDFETSLAEYCAEAIIFGNKPAVLSVKTQAAFLHRSRHVSHAD